jgi:hypothetical protein
MALLLRKLNASCMIISSLQFAVIKTRILRLHSKKYSSQWERCPVSSDARQGLHQSSVWLKGFVPCGIHQTKLFLNTSVWGARNITDPDTWTKSYDQPNWQYKGNIRNGSKCKCRQQSISTCFVTMTQDKNTVTQRRLMILSKFRDSKYLRTILANQIHTLQEIKSRLQFGNASYHAIQATLVSPSHLLYRLKIKNPLQLEPWTKYDSIFSSSLEAMLHLQLRRMNIEVTGIKKGKDKIWNSKQTCTNITIKITTWCLDTVHTVLFTLTHKPT